MSSDEEVHLVVAFDFGTTFSGYAYAYTTNEKEVFLNKQWKGLETNKTSTSVLLKPGGEFDSFGYEAERKYSGFTPEKQKSYKLFDKFKMTLDKDNLYGEPVKVVSRTKEERDGIDVFAMALKSMAERLSKDIAEKHLSFTDYKHIRWVITVPAIWSEGAKQFMRRVAVKAEIIPKLDSKQLVIALEPEAASIYFRNLVIHKFNPENRGQTLPKGTEYVILDCGGGTVDVIAHKVIDDGCVGEIYRATGGPWGGNNVNKNFENLMENVLGKDFITHYSENQPGDWFDFLTEFEKKKREITDPGECLGIQIGMALAKEFSTFSIRNKQPVYDIDDAINKPDIPGVFCSGGKLNIEGDALDNLFKPVIDQIIGHLQGLLQQDPVKNVTHIILVGGFSESPYLKNEVKDTFVERPIEDKYRVLPAEGAEVAIMKGAVMYGNYPPAIHSRMARYTYGYAVNKVFQPFHDEARKYLNQYRNKYYCSNCFNILIKQGDSISYGDVREDVTYPKTPQQTRTTFKFLAIDKKDVTYADEDGVKLLGMLTITSTNTDKGLDRSFKCEFTFGGTELNVRVIEGDTTESVSLKLYGDDN